VDELVVVGRVVLVDVLVVVGRVVLVDVLVVVGRVVLDDVLVVVGRVVDEVCRGGGASSSGQGAVVVLKWSSAGRRRAVLCARNCEASPGRRVSGRQAKPSLATTWAVASVVPGGGRRIDGIDVWCARRCRPSRAGGRDRRTALRGDLLHAVRRRVDVLERQPRGPIGAQHGLPTGPQPWPPRSTIS
jgi:hypothetical protein